MLTACITKEDVYTAILQTSFQYLSYTNILLTAMKVQAPVKIVKFAYKCGSLSHNLQTFPHTRPCFFTWNMGGVEPEIKFRPYLNFNILIFVFFGLHEN